MLLGLMGGRNVKCIEFEEKSYEKKLDLIIHKLQNSE